VLYFTRNTLPGKVISVFNAPVTELIQQRYSCRAYARAPMAPEQAAQLARRAAATKVGPLGTPLRFTLVAAAAGDSRALKGLGTYGLIKNPAGFIIGAAGPGERNLEDFGYAMEAIILYATGLGLGTCWLGGNFTRSSFARRINAAEAEIVPAVAAVGYAAENNRARDWLRRMARSDTRLPWAALFYWAGSNASLDVSAAGPYATPLEMLRLAPSASNHQPWRVVQDGPAYHFYLQRTPGFGQGLPFMLLGLADLQRVDMGIAMCHFELTARELGLAGQWAVRRPPLPPPGGTGEYVVTWVGQEDAAVAESNRRIARTSESACPYVS